MHARAARRRQRRTCLRTCGRCCCKEDPVAADELYAQMKQSVIDGEAEDAERLAREGLDAGLVAGDIHEIGKTIVCSMLSAAGFTVSDVGCDVPVETFVEKCKEEKPDLLLL